MVGSCDWHLVDEIYNILVHRLDESNLCHVDWLNTAYHVCWLNQSWPDPSLKGILHVISRFIHSSWCVSYLHDYGTSVWLMRLRHKSVGNIHSILKQGINERWYDNEFGIHWRFLISVVNVTVEKSCCCCKFVVC